MAAELFSPPSKALDANASPYSGATWEFYASGGLTPQAVYADADLQTSLGDTVTADSSGKFENIYFDASLDYRAICKNSTGSVTLHDIDPVNNSDLAQIPLYKTFVKTPTANPLGPTRGQGDLFVPAGSTFVDNVCYVYNLTDNGSIAGNAAFGFLDSDLTERCAMGYSRNDSLSPGGFFANTFYIEVGNAFTTDDDYTTFSIVNTMAAGSAYWSGAAKQYKAFEYFPHTGGFVVELGSGSGQFIVQGGNTNLAGLDVGSIGTARQLSVAMVATAARLREHGVVNSFALTTNNSGTGTTVTQDDATKSSWKMQLGYGNGTGPSYDSFKVSYSAPGGSAWTDHFYIDNTGFATHVQATDQYAILAWNTRTSGDNKFVLFQTETSPTTRGSITYNRGGGLTAYNTTSDYRAKVILGPVTNAGTIIDAIPVHLGLMHGAIMERPLFVAHEVQEFAPYAVTGEKDAVTEDGTPIFQQLDASTLIPVLWAEVQSLRARVSMLEAA